MIWFCILFMVLAFSDGSDSIKREICSAEDISDTNIEDITYLNSEPSEIMTDKVKILKNLNVNSENECVKTCCRYAECDSVSVIQRKCILFKCRPKDACKPRKGSGVGPKKLYFLLTKISNSTNNNGYRDPEKKLDKDSQACELDIEENCPRNEICKRIQDNRRSGVCVCVAGYTKQSTGCVEDKWVDNNWKPNDKVVAWTSPRSTKQRIDLPDMKGFQNSSTTTKTQNITESTTPRNVHKPETSKPDLLRIKANVGPDLHISVSSPQTSYDMEIFSIHGAAIDRRGKIHSSGIKFHWSRDTSSLSVGTIINNSDHKATLMLTNLLQGQYVFTLTVTDKDGFQSSASVKIFAAEKTDELYNSLIDVRFDTDIYKFTEQESINFSKRMSHVIEKNLPYTNPKVHVKSVTPDRNNKTLVTFYVDTVDPNTKEVHTIPAGLLEEKLKMKLTRHKFIFDYPISKFQSKVCFNPCGYHGKCCPYTHRCKCQLPWMNNPWHESSTGFSNCDMHVMIIVVAILAGVFMLVLIFLTARTLARICRKKKFYGKEVLRYKLLENAES